MEVQGDRTRSTIVSTPDMKGECLSMHLSEELGERILAMIPFPQIFKVRALSKSWLARLSPIATQDDEEKKVLAVSFQKRVREWSYRWKTYSPVFLFHDFLIVYDDRASQHWRKIPTLSSPSNREALKVVELLRSGGAIASLVGVLLLVTRLVTSLPEHITFLVNIFTGNCCQPFPN